MGCFVSKTKYPTYINPTDSMNYLLEICKLQTESPLNYVCTSYCLSSTCISRQRTICIQCSSQDLKANVARTNHLSLNSIDNNKTPSVIKPGLSKDTQVSFLASFPFLLFKTVNSIMSAFFADVCDPGKYLTDIIMQSLDLARLIRRY